MARTAFLLAAIVSLIALGVGELPGPMWVITSILLVGSSWHLFAHPAGDSLNKGNPILLRLLWIGVVFYMLSMIAPLQADHVLFSTVRAEQNISAHDLLQMDPERPSTYNTFCQSRNKAGTSRMFLLCLCVLSAFHWSLNLKQEQAWMLIRGVVIIGSMTALLGFISQHVVDQGKHLWWLFPVRDGQPVGAFPNRSHFGGYIALITPLALFLAAADYENNKRKSFFWLACSSLCIGVVAASLSRGAWISLAVGLISAIVLLRHKRQLAPWAGLTVLASGCAAAILFFVCVPTDDKSGENPIAQRAATLTHLLDTPSAGFRLHTWKSAVHIVQDYPVIGAGPDAFKTVFAQHRDESRRLAFKHAENEYIQLLTDSGLVGLLFLVLSVATFLSLRRCLPADADSLLSMAAIPCVMVAATHAAVEFALHRPVYALTLFIICGASCCQASSIQLPQFKHFDRLLATCSILSLILLLSMGKKVYLYDRDVYIQSAGVSDIHACIQWAPSYWNAWYALGRYHWNQGTPEGKIYAEQCISQAVLYDPNNYRLWQRLYDARKRLGMSDDAQKAYTRAKELRDWLKLEPLEGPTP